RYVLHATAPVWGSALCLHDALPICGPLGRRARGRRRGARRNRCRAQTSGAAVAGAPRSSCFAAPQTRCALIDRPRICSKVDRTPRDNRMHLRKLFVVAAASLCVGVGAMAQTDAATPAQPDASTGAPAKPSKKKKKNGRKKSSKKSSRKKKSSAPAAAAPAPEVPDDGEPPQLTHQLVAAGVRGKPLTIAAHAIDANGVFG